MPTSHPATRDPKPRQYVRDVLRDVLRIAEGNNPNPASLGDEDKATLKEAHHIVRAWFGS